jgi:menaquinone-specific isochorismate synthase
MTMLPTTDDALGGGQPSPLVARTVRVPLAVAEDLLALLPGVADPRQVSSWVRRGEGIVGWGRALEFRGGGPHRFRAAQAWWRRVTAHAAVRDEISVPGTGPVAFGSISYAAGSAAGASLVVPEVVVGRRGELAWVTTMTTEAALPPPAVVTRQPDPMVPADVTFTDGPLSVNAWAGAVAEAVRRIGDDELDKVVLARSLEARSPHHVDPRWMLRYLAEHYDTTWVFAVDGLVGATPEMLVRLEKGLVTSRVLAGTIQRTGDDEHDLALAGSLARSSKDLEEHEYAVRSVADALLPHCSSMSVPESPFVLHLSNVMHLATDVNGVVHDDSTSLGLAASLHPSAAVCGTPTPVADSVIAELEQMDRGRYAGPVGWMDSRGNGEWGIALRCGSYDREDPAHLRLYAGCGIVAGSDPDAEVAESDAKFIPMRDALSGTP